MAIIQAFERFVTRVSNVAKLRMYATNASGLSTAGDNLHNDRFIKTAVLSRMLSMTRNQCKQVSASRKNAQNNAHQRSWERLSPESTVAPDMNGGVVQTEHCYNGRPASGPFKSGTVTLRWKRRSLA
jgi:hypothetical protein